jgi:hypothetical protein
MIDRFVFLAHGGWGPETVRSLHPDDIARLAGIIRHAHAKGASLSPDDFESDLRARGFHTEMAARLADRYRFGRIVLAMQLYPWSRAKSWEERIRRQNSFRRAAF